MLLVVLLMNKLNLNGGFLGSNDNFLNCLNVLND